MIYTLNKSVGLWQKHHRCNSKLHSLLHWYTVDWSESVCSQHLQVSWYTRRLDTPLLGTMKQTLLSFCFKDYGFVWHADHVQNIPSTGGFEGGQVGALAPQISTVPSQVAHYEHMLHFTSLCGADWVEGLGLHQSDRRLWRDKGTCPMKFELQTHPLHSSTCSFWTSTSRAFSFASTHRIDTNLGMQTRVGMNFTADCKSLATRKWIVQNHHIIILYESTYFMQEALY